MRDLSIIEGPYLRDILSQPQALQDTLQRLENSPPLEKVADRLSRGEFQRILLTGMGASLHALYPITLELVDRGFTAMMVETSELIHYQSSLLDRKTLIIAVSQSGQSAEIVRLLAQNRGSASLIAVTNNSDSLLAQRADAVVQNGPEVARRSPLQKGLAAHATRTQASCHGLLHISFNMGNPCPQPYAQVRGHC